MVNMITGARNAGKSTYFLHLYQEAETGVGLFSKKCLDAEGNVNGYDLQLLPGGDLFPLARLCSESSLFPKTDQLHQGRFVFSQSAFNQGISYILKQFPSSVWLDEIGQLELRGLGYAHLLQYVLDKDVDITLTIRDTYLPDFLSTYSIMNFRIHSCPQFNDKKNGATFFSTLRK